MMDTIAIRLPADQIAALKVTAQKQGKTVSDLVRTAISKTLTQKKPGNLAEDLLKIAEKGRGIKAPKDLSTNYKKYLYGKYRIE